MKYPFRFEKVRPFQKEMMDDVFSALKSKSNILLNAPTGVGKTDASISAALPFALENGLDVLFLTPKISQHRIALEALSGIKAQFYKDLKFVDIVGKQKMCTNPAANMLEGEVFYSKCENLVKQGRCPFYKAFKEYAKDDSIPEEISASAFMGHNRMLGASYDFGVCAYEMSMHLARSASVIIADYSHILNPGVKVPFLKKISHTLHNSVIIWDEAHNVIEAASSYFNKSVTTRTIDFAARELAAVGSDIDLDYLRFSLNSLSQKLLSQKDSAFVEQGMLPESMTANPEITKSLQKAGLEYMEKTGMKRSSVLRIARFIESWNDGDETLTRIISRKGGMLKLSINCLYPSKALSVFDDAYANIFMSATLAPLRMYSDMFGIPGASAKHYMSPFSPSNRLAVIDDSVTTKYTSRTVDEYKRIAERIDHVANRIPGNVAVFFPSFSILENVKRYMTLKTNAQRREMRSLETERMIESLKSEHNSIMLGVMGGSLSEGVDYAGNVIKGIIIVGIPLAPPDLELSARISYLDQKFGGKGSEYGYTIPAMRRVIQAAGRAIRSESDRAAIVFMDRRYRWRIYSSMIESSLGLSEPPDYLAAIDRFWKADAARVRGTA